MLGDGLSWFPTFSPNLVSDKIVDFMKVTGNQGHHHLTFDFWFAHKFSYIHWMNPNHVFLVFIDWYWCHLWKFTNIYTFYFQLRSCLYIIYKRFLIHLNNYKKLNLTLTITLYFIYVFFVIKIQNLESKITRYKFPLVHFSSWWELRRYNIQSSSISSFLFI